jgi:hypothetical protein
VLRDAVVDESTMTMNRHEVAVEDIDRSGTEVRSVEPVTMLTIRQR